MIVVLSPVNISDSDIFDWTLGNGMENLYGNEYISMYGLGNQVMKGAFR